MVTYNLLWGVAWFAFMQREWVDAMAATRRSMPFTAEVWFLMVVLSLPIGVAIMVYTSSRQRPALLTAVYAGLSLWVLMTLGMTGWGWQDSISMRVLALDSIVNLVAMVAASLAGVWSLREGSAP